MGRATHFTSSIVLLGIVLLFVSVSAVGYSTVAAQSALPSIDQITNPAAADNPWNEVPITVYIAHDGTDSAGLESLVQSELRHWENNSQRYAGSNVTFLLTGKRASADLVIIFQMNVTCGKPNSIGCSQRTVFPRTGTLHHATVWVETGKERWVMRETLRHEIGHVFGLSHDDAAEFPFMYYAIKGEPDEETHGDA